MIQPLGLSITGSGANSTRLQFGEMTSGEMLVLDGTTIKTQAISGGGEPTGDAGGDLDGTYPNPTVVAGQFSGTRLTLGSVTTGQILTRSGTSIIGRALPTLSQTLAVGNTTGGYDVILSSGTTITSPTSIPLNIESGTSASLNITGNLINIESTGSYLNLKTASSVVLNSTSSSTANMITTPVSGNSQNIGISSGACYGTGNSGDISIYSGSVVSGSNGSGDISIYTSDNNSVTGTTGTISLTTGQGHAGNSGGISISTGDGGGGTTGSGDIILTTGSGGSGDTGSIGFHLGTRGSGDIGRVYSYSIVSGYASIYEALAYSELGNFS